MQVPVGGVSMQSFIHHLLSQNGTLRRRQFLHAVTKFANPALCSDNIHLSQLQFIEKVANQSQSNHEFVSVEIETQYQ